MGYIVHVHCTHIFRVPQVNNSVLLTIFSVRLAVLFLRNFSGLLLPTVVCLCPHMPLQLMPQFLQVTVKWVLRWWAARWQTGWDHQNISTICIILTCSESSSISLEIAWAGPSFTGLTSLSWVIAQRVKMPIKQLVHKQTRVEHLFVMNYIHLEKCPVVWKG